MKRGKQLTTKQPELAMFEQAYTSHMYTPYTPRINPFPSGIGRNYGL